MNTRLLRMIDAIRVVLRETRVWRHHLTGEGPTTVGRQREIVAQALAAPPPPASLAERAPAHEQRGRLEGPAATATPGHQPVLSAR
jgi:hypothetical protein